MEIGYKYCLFSTKEKHDTMTTDQKCTKTNGRKDEKKRSEKDLMKGSVKVKKKKIKVMLYARSWTSQRRAALEAVS